MSKRRVPWPNVRRQVSGATTPLRMWLLTVIAAVLGLVGGVAAVALFKLIGLISHLTLLHTVGFSLPTLRGYHPGPLIIATTVLGALVVSAFAVWAPVIRGHGIPESLEAILVRESRIPLRAAIAKPLSAAICIGTGGPFGAEGPIIVTGGSIGSLVGQFLPVSPAERKILLATGAAAGMSATFNAPLASVVLAVELLLFERSLRTIVPVATAAAVAAGVRVLVFGSTPLFYVHAHLSVGLGHLPLFVLVGLAAGLLAVVLNKGLFAVEAGFRKLPVGILWWPALGAVGYALIGMVEPRTLSLGYSAISDTLNNHFALSALAALFGAKLLAWWLALGSQTSGGTLAPMFLVGAAMGGILGDALSVALPGAHIVPAAFALVAMGATFAAAAKAPLTAVVFCFEVTGQYSMVIPLMIGVAAAELTAQLFLGDRIMTEKLTHRGFRIDFDMEVDVLRQWVVRQAMRAPVALSPCETVGAARQVAAQAGATTVAVAGEDGSYLGMVPPSILGLPPTLLPASPDLVDLKDAGMEGAGVESVGVEETIVNGGRPGDIHVGSASVGRGVGDITSVGRGVGDITPGNVLAGGANRDLLAGDAIGEDSAADDTTVEGVQSGTVLPQDDLKPGTSPGGDQSIGSVAVDRPRALEPDEHLLTALVYLIEHGLAGLPVVEDGRVIGHLRRADIDAHRLRRHTHYETIQPGLTLRRRGRDRGLLADVLPTAADGPGLERDPFGE